MSLKFILISLAAIAGTSYLLYAASNRNVNSPLDVETSVAFFGFKEAFGKSYSSSDELAYRQGVFAMNLKKINEHNMDENQTYKLGVNQFTDMTFEELSAKYLTDLSGLKGDAKCEKSSRDFSIINDDSTEVDWNKAGKVHPAKNQAECGSCWAFSTVGALESAYAIYENVAVPNISEQELVDCSSDYGNNGCNGGLMANGFDYILDHHINSEKKYPYNALDNDCNGELSGHGEYQIKGCVQAEASVQGLVDALRKQPVSVAFHVKDDFFQYSSGVYAPHSCDTQPNHGVLAVGFNTGAKVPYYIVKNSWGQSWGDNGFFKIAMGTNSEGTCGIAGSGANYYPVV